MNEIFELTKIKKALNKPKQYSSNKNNWSTPMHLKLSNKRTVMASQTFGIRNFLSNIQMLPTLTEFKLLHYNMIKNVEEKVLGYSFKNKYYLL